MQEQALNRCMTIHAALLQAMRAWFHAAHQVTNGTGFHGDHDLYKEIYEAANDNFDVVIEKSIGIAGCEMIASPCAIMQNACKILSMNPDPVGMTSLAIAVAGHKMLCKYTQFLKEINEELEACGCLTLGLDDFHAATANAFETFIYKLGQRVKTSLED